MPKKVVIITGAAGGIGRAAALEFARKGHYLALADIDAKALEVTGELLSEQNHSDYILLAGDLSEEDHLIQLVEKTFERWGSIDILVNNAAWRTIETMRSIQWETWEKTIRICLTAPAFLSQMVAKKMESAGNGGVIVNVSSVMAGRPAGTSPAYIASKGALESLTAELAITYGRSGIRVVGVSPGYIETDLSNDYTDDSGNNISDLLTEDLNDSIPLARGGKAVEVAEAIVWISSENAGYITGTTLLVDGGFKPNFSKYSLKKLQFPDEF